MSSGWATQHTTLGKESRKELSIRSKLLRRPTCTTCFNVNRSLFLVRPKIIPAQKASPAPLELTIAPSQSGIEGSLTDNTEGSQFPTWSASGGEAKHSPLFRAAYAPPSPMVTVTRDTPLSRNLPYNTVQYSSVSGLLVWIWTRYRRHPGNLHIGERATGVHKFTCDEDQEDLPWCWSRNIPMDARDGFSLIQVNVKKINIRERWGQYLYMFFSPDIFVIRTIQVLCTKR